MREGGSVVALTSTGDGRLSGVRLRVTGQWFTPGLEAYEWGTCYTDLSVVQELLDAADGAAVLVFRQRDPDEDSEKIAANLNADFGRTGAQLEAHSWREMGDVFLGTAMLSRLLAAFAYIAMGIVVGASVLNTFLIAVFERTREVGTLRAIGLRRPRILTLFVLESVLLGLAGATAGAVLGGSLIEGCRHVGIPAITEAQRYAYGGDYLFPVLNWSDLVLIPLGMTLICVAAGLAPAWRASRMRPVDALRYV